MQTMISIDVEALPDRLAGDLDASFPDLVRALQDDLYSGALRLTRDHHAAEDITQEALVRAYRALGGYPPDRIRELRLRGWIWTIAVNLCRNRARSRSRKPETALDVREPEDRATGPEQQALDILGLDRLADALGALPWAQRAGVVLRHVVGLTIEETAEALDRPAGTVKSDVHRGLARLRTLLEDQR
jgi:RNA polymerase sigma-70 factor (ECF subfamily)